MDLKEGPTEAICQGGLTMEQGAPGRFTSLPPAARIVWAKSDDGAGHGLLAHLLDVAAVAEVLLAHEPAATRDMAAQALGLATEATGRWLAALVGLHDFGKAIPGFQAKWQAGYERDLAAGLPFVTKSLACDQHSLATAALLTPSLQRLSGAERQWCCHVVQAVSAHHGYHFSRSELKRGTPLREGPGWQEARQSLIHVYWSVLAPPGRPNASALDLPMVNWLAGLTSVADWIASNPEWFPLGERCDDLAAYYADAQTLAQNALQQIGWRPHRPLLTSSDEVHALLARIVDRPGIQPRPLQQVGDELLKEAQGPALLLVEAPMGEGKTELAFLAHLRLQALNHHRGLYVALPTQATGNALFKRAETFLRAFAPGALDVQLVHGGAAMNEDLAALRDIDHSRNETLSASVWFGQRRRPLLSPYGVGTVDQTLYAVLNVKHHFVRMWGLSNRVVVLDEIHAYDTYTLNLIITLLRWLKALRCSVVLMSATLPRARCQELLKAWGLTTPAPQLAYPRLMLADDAGVQGRHVAARPLAPIALHGLDSGIEALAEVALAQLEAGGCGALIVNTVARAQALYLMLKARLSESDRSTDTQLLLFHARFPADERGDLEKSVLSLFGAGGVRPARALLVATQVAEQSLDIDFDFLLSDLAPVDLLLQRAGRLHRHERPQRPAAHRDARLWVAGLLPGRLPEMKQTAWGYVYDPYILGRTWALLTRESVLHLPQDIDRLVQAVYDINHELPDDLDTEARKFVEIDAYGEYRAEVKSQLQRAFDIALDPSAEAQLAYDGKPHGHEEDEAGLGLTNTTRLGPESITLIPVVVDDQGRWHVREGDAGFDPEQPLDGLTARALYNRQLKVSRKGVVQRCKAMRLPVAFESHPLLRQAFALRIQAGRTIDPGLTMSLSPELGLQFGDGREADKTQEGAA
ncbi:CRISPR-associated helicase Cas3' [Roseateles amylovorans]|uniref:CRISPR-associated helicase Cas3 n=1 Tax=Roseateles amylovorans TaxID=2978473 RepID=A0ABY6AWL1_9BURK|nr:CRISPR-associated helicase Cas3' [Roseateles amylovorans]UXH76794.1 CRISPR-associated helicase Cas3' [Roseateles amylovorans]